MRKLIRFFLLPATLLLSATTGHSVVVHTPGELKANLENAGVRTVIQLAAGEWKDLEITVKGTGKATGPLVVKAAEPGKTILTGKTSLVLDGEFIVIEGLCFRNAVPADGAEALITFRNKDGRESSNCRITHVLFEDCNPEDPSINYPWIRMYGHNNRVDHCRFSGQDHAGRAIQVRVHEPDPGHCIDHNHFIDRKPGLESNGYEVIQIGLSGDSMKDGNVLVENNIFERCDGETEIISCKSFRNVIRNNLFLDCSGTVTLRHGDLGRVVDNAFIGNGKDRSGGVRIVGNGHRVEGNFFSSLTGRTGGVVVLYCGIPDSPLNGYFAASGTRLRNNIFHRNLGNAIYLTGGFGQRNRVLLPENVRIEGNVFGPPDAGGAVAVAGDLPDVVFENNPYSSGVELGGARETGFTAETLIFVENESGLAEPYRVTDGIRESEPLLHAPKIPSRQDVGPGWHVGIPELSLMDNKALFELQGSAEQRELPVRQKLLEEAEDILARGRIYSVTTNDRLPPSGNKRDYYSTGPYWWPNPDTPDGLPYINIDGKFNPERDRVSDRQPLLDMMHDVRILALAHLATGYEQYAVFAGRLLRAWFLDDSTGMRPNLNHAQAIPGRNTGRGRGIIDTHPFTELVDALLVLETSRALDTKEWERLHRWFRQYVDWLLSSENGLEEQAAVNNHGTAYDMQVAALLWYTGQTERLQAYLRNVSLPRITSQINADGSQPHELARTRTWSYCTENLEHFFKLGRIAQKVDVDFFNLQSPGDRRLKAALDFLVPYVCDPDSWPYTQDTEWQDAFIANVLAIAVSVYKDEAYLAALDCLGARAGLSPFLLEKK